MENEAECVFVILHNIQKLSAAGLPSSQVGVALCCPSSSHNMVLFKLGGCVEGAATEERCGVDGMRREFLLGR